MTLIILFIIGLCIGSFLNVVVDRSVRGESFIANRSHCDMCGHMLAWYDLIPVISFLTLKGTCRYCKKKIGWKYPLLEISTGSLFILTYILLVQFLHNFNLYEMLFYLFITSCLIVIFFADMFYGIIPDIVLIPMGIITLIRTILSVNYLLLPTLLAAFGAGLFFLIIFLATKGRGMGFGDVKFAVVMGLLLGFPSVGLAVYLAFLTGAIASLILIIARKKRLRGGTISFGPFLVLGTYICLFFGTALWQNIITYLF